MILGFEGADYTLVRNGARLLDCRTYYFYYATINTPAMIRKVVGAGSQYLMAFKDGQGERLDGAKTYTLHLPPGIPVKNFWSLVVYDNQTRSMLQTDAQFPSIGSQKQGIVANPDTSVDVYFGPEAPTGKEGNWVQTVPGYRDFFHHIAEPMDTMCALLRTGPRPSLWTPTPGATRGAAATTPAPAATAASGSTATAPDRPDEQEGTGMADQAVARPTGPSRLFRLVPGLRTVRSYRREWLAKDIIAGVVLTTLLVPQGMAYAELAGLPPITGLYTSIMCLLGYAVLGPSRILVLGPDSSLGPMIAATILPLAGAGGDPGRAVAPASMLAIMVAAIMIVAAVAKLGFIADLISKPTMIGYMNGLALTILVGQLPKLFGFKVETEGLIGEITGFVKGWLTARRWPPRPRSGSPGSR